MTSYFITIGIFIFLMIVSKIVMLYAEQSETKKVATKVFATPYGKLFVYKHDRGIEVENDYGQRAVIESMSIDKVTESIAQSILMTAF